MSQAKKIQKMQVGGRFRMNGRELEGQLALDRLASAYAGSSARERGMWDVAQRAIQDGHIAQYNANNSIQVFDADGNDITRNYTNTKAGTEDKWLKRTLDAVAQNESDGFKRSGRYMSMVDMNPEAEKEDTPTISKTKLQRGEGWFYDDKGNYKDDIYNQNRLNIISKIRAYFDDENQDTLKDRYDLSGWDENLMDAFRTYYGEQVDKNAFWDNLTNAIKGNTLSDYQKSFLKSWGFNDGVVAGSGDGSGDSTDDNGIHKDWKGDRTAAKNRGVGIRRGDDGYWYITGDNDYFGHNWYTGGLDFLKGTDYYNEGFITSDGRLWTSQEARNSGNSVFNPWFTAVKATNYRDLYDRITNSGFRFVNDRTGKENDYYGVFGTQYNPNTHYNQIWQKHFEGRTNPVNIADVSRSYLDLGNKQILAYIDEHSKRNIAGMYIPSYVVYDPSNKENPYTSYANETALLNAGFKGDPWGGVSTNFELNPWQQVKKGSYAIYGNPIGKAGMQNTIWIDNQGDFYLGKKNDKGQPMNPKRIVNQDEIDAILAGNYYDRYSKMDSAALENAFTKLNSRQRGERAQQLYAPSWNFTPLRKEGGSIPKLQYGNTVDSTDTKVVSKELKDSETDITQWHALDGSQGALTTAEWTKIGAAMGDLAGVGLTFVPGYGNIAGAVTGAGASLANYSAEKQMGTTNAGGHLAMNLVLDAASLIPLLGTGAKAAKAANAIRRVGAPVIKLLSLYGASAPVITAVKKIQNGEKYTSKDLAEAISGISAAVVAGKQYATDVQQSKLAEKLAGKRTKIDNTHLNDVKKTTIVGKDGKSFVDESTPESLANFVKDNPTRSQAVKAMQATAAKANVELSEPQAEAALKKIGIDVKEGKLRVLPWKQKSSGVGFWQKHDGTVSYEAPKEAKPYSAFGYFISPKRRAEVLGSEAVYGFKIGKGNNRLNKEGYLGDIAPSRIMAAQRMAQAGRANAEAKAILDLTTYTPWAFGNKFNTWETWGARKNPLYIESEPLTDWRNLTFGGRRFRPLKYQFGNDSGPNLGVGYPADALANPMGSRFNLIDVNAINEAAAARRYNGLIRYIGNQAAQNPDFILGMKKGGKLVKAQGGTYIPEWQRNPNVTYNVNGQPIAVHGFSLNSRGMMWPQTGSKTIEETPPATKPVAKRKPVVKTAGTKTDKQAIAQPVTQTVTPEIETTVTQPTTNTQSPTALLGAQSRLNFNSLDGIGMPGVYDWRKANMPTVDVNGGDYQSLTYKAGRLNAERNPLQLSTTYHLGSLINPNDVTVNAKGNDLSSFLNAQQDSINKDLTNAINDKSNGKSFAGGLWEDIKANAANFADNLSAGFATNLHFNKLLPNYLKSHAILGTRSFQAPQMAQAVKNFGDLYQKFASVREPLLNAKNVSSDGHANVAFNLGRAEKLADVNRQEGAEISARNSEYNEMNRQIGNYNTEQNVGIANLRSQYYTNWDSQRPLIINNAIEQWDTKVRQPIDYQNRQNLRNEQNANAQLDYEGALRTAQLNAKAEFDRKMSPYKDQWLKSDAYKNNVDFEDWMMADTTRADKYNTAYKTMQNSIYGDTVDTRRNLNWWYGPGLLRFNTGAPGVAYAKKGGKTKYHREVTEELAINTSKHAQQSAQKLSDNLVRLLMQLMKIK